MTAHYSNRPVSDAELQRRWTAARAAMGEQDIDALLIFGNNDYMTGYGKYLTDVPATFGYPTTLVFPADDAMSIVAHGPLDSEHAPSPTSPYRGVGRVLTTSSFSTAFFTNMLDAAQVAKALKPYASGTVGIAGMMSMPIAMMDWLRSNGFAATRFVDASDLVDRIKAVKSAEEIDLARETALLQSRVLEQVFAQIRPGMTENDVAAEAQYRMRLAGSEQGAYLVSSGPMGSCTPLRAPHNHTRTLEAGDQLHLLIEANGPGGIYVEIGRVAILGEATASMREQAKFVLGARHFVLNMLQPGATGAQIWASYNEFLAGHGQPAEQRLFLHGQGYDLVERPLMRPDEPMPLAAGMVMALHPTVVDATSYSWICDDYLVTDTGPVRLHDSEERLFELG